MMTNKQDAKQLMLIIPCYNEQDLIDSSAEILIKKLEYLIDKNLISENSKIVFVNDGSSDNTLKKIEYLLEQNKKFALINLTRNFGHQKAIFAGMNTVNSDMVITLDADLQDDVNAIEEMINLYYEGNDIVYGCRKNRFGDTFFKKYSAMLFYKILKFLSPKVISNHADFRLMSRKAINLLSEYKEKNLFLRGLIPSLGLKSATVLYDRLPRNAGETKYSLYKMLDLAICGIINHSNLPLRMIALLGIFLGILSIISIILLLLDYFCYGKLHKLFILIAFMGLFSGLIILVLGIVAEYISIILKEVKDNPIYQIESVKNI